tara:strand:+ start:68 stop:622 length:555 start_codon:yes stop_codon:yes gene_type:complete
MNKLTNQLNDHIETISSLQKFENELNKLISKVKKTILNNNKVIFCGNGGSAADSEHLCAELIGRFKSNRHPYPALSLNSNIANITCISNDFGYENVFSRQLEGIGSKNDILLTYTTSGNSQNIINVLAQAKKMQITTVAFLGKDGGECKGLADFEFLINSFDTARIQECHMFIGHFICSQLEEI